MSRGNLNLCFFYMMYLLIIKSIKLLKHNHRWSEGRLQLVAISLHYGRMDNVISHGMLFSLWYVIKKTLAVITTYYVAKKTRSGSGSKIALRIKHVWISSGLFGSGESWSTPIQA